MIIKVFVKKNLWRNGHTLCKPTCILSFLIVTQVNSVFAELVGTQL